MDNVIVFINAEEKKVYLFGKQTTIVDFQDSYLLPAFLKNMNVFYISAMEEVDGADVITMVSEMQENEEPHGRYIRSKAKDYVRIPDAKLNFAGPRDIKSLDKIGYNIFDKSSHLLQMLKNNEVEILSEEEAKSLKKALPVASRNQSSDILLTTSVSDFHQDSIFDDPNALEVKDEDGEVLTDADVMIRKGFGKAE